MDAAGTGVTFENRLENLGDKPAQWSIWQVTQVASPDRVRMPLYSKGAFRQGYYVFPDADPAPGRLQRVGEEAILTRDANKSSKIGGDSPLGWLAAEKGEIRMEVSVKLQAGKPYPYEGCLLEVWTNPDPLPYVELELLGPLTEIAPRQKTALQTRWVLKRGR